MKKELSKVESEEHEQGSSVVLPRSLKVQREELNRRKPKVTLKLFLG